MDKFITIYIDGSPFEVKEGTILSIALADAGITEFHKSPSGTLRGPLCGMGTCFECTVTVNGMQHCRSCQTRCSHEMKVETI